MKKKKTGKLKARGNYSIRVSEEEQKRLQARADQFSKGNLSTFLRHAGLNYTPRKGEKITSLRPA